MEWGRRYGGRQAVPRIPRTRSVQNPDVSGNITAGTQLRTTSCRRCSPGCRHDCLLSFPLEEVTRSVCMLIDLPPGGDPNTMAAPTPYSKRNCPSHFFRFLISILEFVYGRRWIFPSAVSTCRPPPERGALIVDNMVRCVVSTVE